MIKRRVIIRIFAVGFLLLLTIQAINFSYMSNFGNNIFHTYHFFGIDQDKISLKIPEYWVGGRINPNSKVNSEIIAIVDLPFNPSHVITVRKKEFISGDINSVAQWGNELNKNQTGYQSLFLSNYIGINISGLRRSSLFALNKSDNGENNIKRCDEVYLKINDEGYIFSFCAGKSTWERWQTLFEFIISSIKLQS